MRNFLHYNIEDEKSWFARFIHKWSTTEVAPSGESHKVNPEIKPLIEKNSKQPDTIRRAEEEQGVQKETQRNFADIMLEKLEHATLNLTSSASGIETDKLEEAVQGVNKLFENDGASKLDKYLSSFEKLQKFQEKIANSFLGEFFLGKFENFQISEYMESDNAGNYKVKGAREIVGAKYKDKEGNFLSKGWNATKGFFVYSSVKLFLRSNPQILEYYSTAEKLIKTVGPLVEKVKNLGPQAIEAWEKLHLSKEKVAFGKMAAKTTVEKVKEAFSNFMKNPKATSQEMSVALTECSQVPGCAELLQKETKIGKFFEFKGPIVFLATGAINNWIMGENLSSPETTAEKWIPGIGLLNHEWPALIASIEQNGIGNSKLEIASFLLKAGFDVATIWAIIAAMMALAPAVLAGSATVGAVATTTALAGAEVAGRRGLVVVMKDIFAAAIEKVMTEVTDKEALMVLAKKTAAVGTLNCGPTVLAKIALSQADKINTSVKKAAEITGGYVMQRVFGKNAPAVEKIYSYYKSANWRN